MGLLNTNSNHIQLQNNNDAIQESKRSFFHQQALNTFLACLTETLGFTKRAMRPVIIATAMQYIQEETTFENCRRVLAFFSHRVANQSIHQNGRQHSQ